MTAERTHRWGDRTVEKPTTTHVLVVCTANICRSPLGEVVLRTHAQHLLGPGVGAVRIHSAGVNARSGDPAADGSVRCAEAWDVDLGDHRSTPIDAAMVQRTDLVLTMSTRQRGVVLDEVPDAGGRVFTWLEMVRLLADADVPAATTVGERVRAATATAHQRRPRVATPRRGDTVKDPYGKAFEHYVRTADLLAEGGDVLGPALFTVDAPPPPPTA